ncbi:Na/Pi symporter [Evansella sp. AB-P1]|uniref:Na/Pi symporter n=1 Tax=Evansella sp. AB-P1 TaxID=3037653 RepID=UPI00241D18E2|nr:Na/Pi symporter [Evansella sp. AB-P1]MDG5786539.1 Na/Pi symporter [Evansella sp. AB-P1]
MNHILSMFAIYIALFLFGMTVMRQGLLHIQGERMKKWLHNTINHPLKGFGVGIIVTAILQSSSAVMIITIGLVSAGFIYFRHSIGIILGANIGTVVTLEILAFDLTWLIFPFLILGVPLLFTKKQVLFCIGCFFFGFSCILIAMHGFETLAYPLSSLTIVYEWLLSTNEYNIVALSAGVILSAIIQSSSAVTAIAMSFMNENLLILTSSILIMLGANLGTCVTAWLASLGGSKEAKLTAYTHIWVNLIGIVLFLPFISLFSAVIEGLAISPSQQLAHAALAFNVISSTIFLPFINHFAVFVQWIHKTSID